MLPRKCPTQQNKTGQFICSKTGHLYLLLTWDSETYISLGAVLMRSGNDQLKKYGKEVLDDYLLELELKENRLELKENSANCYYKGRAAYLLEDYGKAKEFFDTSESKQWDERLLSSAQMHNIDVWQTKCIAELSRQRRRP